VTAAGSHPGPAVPERRLATVDLGTNTVRLLVVEARGADWRPLYEAQRVTRLGEGQSASGTLGAAAMARTADVVAKFAQEARALGAADIHVVATSAVREAANRAEFASLVRAATGLDLHVVSGEEEARLALHGVSAGLPALGGTFVLVDIGGGSTEIVRAEAGRVRAAVSLSLGVVALAERFVGPGPVDWDAFALLRRDVDRRLAFGLPGDLHALPRPALVGSAGTVTTLAALDLGLARYAADRVQGHALGRPAVERLLGRLAGLTVAEREALPCVEAGRGDLLIAGIAILLAVLDRLGRESLIVSDHGLREGIVHDLLRGAARPGSRQGV
jgi:exopolyphosphatase/guanosine-5'-triphosphate,3'-diphosphate pyrophosphatase